MVTFFQKKEKKEMLGGESALQLQLLNSVSQLATTYEARGMIDALSFDPSSSPFMKVL